MNRATLGPAVTDNAMVVVSLIGLGAVIGVTICVVLTDRLVRRFVNW